MEGHPDPLTTHAQTHRLTHTHLHIYVNQDGGDMTNYREN